MSKILYIDDESVNLDTFRDAFDDDYTVLTALSGKEALEIIDKEEIAIVLADQRMPGMTGIELCERLVKSHPETIRIILTAYTEVKLLLDAIRRGHVQDYIVKPWEKQTLKPVIDKFLKEYEERQQKLLQLESRLAKVDSLEEDVQKIYDNRGIVGTESGLKDIMEMLHKAAPTDSTVLLLGETGTGKELLARAIHAESRRKEGPFIPVHCAALAKTLLESELFGHEKGAFTGADHSRAGRFELANRGTIFLDEIGEIPEETQVKLLRVLQEREVQRVGGNRCIPVDVRLVTATNKDLKQEVDEGRFREDLFYRLNVIPIRVPPLRDRKEDIPILAKFFLRKYTAKTGNEMSLPTETLRYMEQYDWPGNIRELENIIERAVILNVGPVIEPEDLNLQVEEMARVEKVDLEKVDASKPLRSQIQDLQMQKLADALTRSGGNISETARILGLARSTVFHRLKKYRLI